MKKVKVLFGAMAIFAVVGTTLAFKSYDKNAVTIWQLNGSETACPSFTLPGAILTVQAQAQNTFNDATTSNPGGTLSNCDETIYTRSEG